MEEEVFHPQGFGACNRPPNILKLFALITNESIQQPKDFGPLFEPVPGEYPFLLIQKQFVDFMSASERQRRSMNFTVNRFRLF
jgi:hypothetical protein